MGNMKTSLVLTLIGADRAGLVEMISQTAVRHGANWEASRMARLGGRFAGLLSVSLEPERAAKLRADLEGLAESGLRVVVEASSEEAPRKGWRDLHLEVLGTDRTGIIAGVAQVVQEDGLNFEELTTQCDPAPMGGGEIFRMCASLKCPPGVSLDELRRRLEALANDLMVDITLGDEA